MYPSIQAKIWGNIGQVADLLDMVLDSFIKVCISHQNIQNLLKIKDKSYFEDIIHKDQYFKKCVRPELY